MYVAVYIIIIIILVVRAIFYSNVKKISENYKKLIELNEKYIFQDFNSKFRTEYFYAKDLKSYRNAYFDFILENYVINNVGFLKTDIDIAKKNKKLYEEYLLEYDKINYTTDEELVKKMVFKKEIFNYIEKRLMKKYKVSPSVYNFAREIVISYTSPKGRNHYEKRKSYKWEDLIKYNTNFESEKENYNTLKREPMLINKNDEIEKEKLKQERYEKLKQERYEKAVEEFKMNNDDLKLYTDLTNLKEKLQNENYDYSNNKKPAICSDEAIKLLVKYKPTKLRELHNITGLGEVFINNYGEKFIDEIKKGKIKDDIIEMDDQEKQLLKKLENRLININSNNPLLYSGKIKKGNNVDLFKIVDNIDELESFIINQSTGSFKILDSIDLDDSNYKMLATLIRQVKKIDNESGNNELYIAYPFVQGKYEDENFIVKAPLLLFPVTISRDGNCINLQNDNTRDILYNTTLILANNKFKGVNNVLPDNAVNEFNPDNYKIDMQKFYKSNGLSINYNSDQMEKFLENTKKEFPSYNNGVLEVKNYMVLGLYSMYATSMCQDFEQLIEDNDMTGLIKELLYGVENIENGTLISYDEKEDKEQNNKTIEEEINYINELDFSQEKVLREINNRNAIVVQGPPGTGKSQTITSIISQNILKNKNLLMVSEKKTALDVIYSRLGDLSKFAIIIDDIEDKSEFYGKLNSIINTLNENEDNLYEISVSKETIENDIKENIDKINQDIDHLELIANKIYEINDFGTSMYDLYKKCKRINLTDPNEKAIYDFISNELNLNPINIDYPLLVKVNTFFNNEQNSNTFCEYFKVINTNKELANIKNNLIDYEIIEFNHDLSTLENDIKRVKSLPFLKKFLEEKSLNNKANEIVNKYFTKHSNTLAKYLIDNVEYMQKFLSDYYKDFISYQYLFEKLKDYEQKYLLLINDIQCKFNLSFKNANDTIFNTILYNKINEFERNNTEVSIYMNNFENIRSEINRNIREKKELTRKLAYNILLNDLSNLKVNSKLTKIEEMCNRPRKMALNKFMEKYRFEMLDSIKIWLMTPEVVSDLLPFDKNLFDLVIFDEASQLYVEKAIPAIYRSKKVVVAGDQKQLKPSSLFLGRIIDETDEDEIYDGFTEYESLLEAARYKYKSTMLNYHYRSKYKELIDFSNYAFYDGKLLTTSIIDKKNIKPIERIKVENGMWIDKTNELEAYSVIKLIKEILKTRENNETIGVITFNSSQMELIENLIEKEKMRDQEFATKMMTEERRTHNGENVGFFVKNIETVQGDERDIIIFCIGYAKNEKGRVAINFGTLNQDGGENRLNVAISRAKEKIYVITSIEPDDLVVENTKNNGPKLFKKYLEYVKALNDGQDELSKQILLSLLDKNIADGSTLTFDSEFEEEVCNKLQALGYNVLTQYNVGGYRIDLVIQDNEGNNVLGIECDGRLYHSSKSARERDYHRQKYLEDRGWKIYRIWSPNWWKNPDGEIKKINDFINNLIK